MIEAALIVGVLGTVFARAAWRAHTNAATHSALSADGDVIVGTAPGWLNPLTIDTRPPRRPARLIAEGDHQHAPAARWEVTTTSALIGQRSTVHITREGVLGAVRDAVGVHDVTLGHADIDRRMCLRGNEPDGLRAMCSTPEALRALDALFADRDFISLHVHEDGKVFGTFKRGFAEAGDVKRKLLAIVDVVNALEAGSTRAALPSAGSGPASLGGASGAPVSISIGEPR